MQALAGGVVRFYRCFSSMRTGIFLLGMLAGSLALSSFISVDIYHTSFFYLLLVSLCINTALCSVERLWKKLRAVHDLPNPREGASFHEFVRNADPAVICASLEKMLKLAGFKTSLRETAGQYMLRGERGVTAVWGMFGVHISIVFIAAGVLYGAYAGYDRTVVLTEGASHIIEQTDQPFVVRLNKFSTTYYGDGTVSDWISDVTVEQNGQAVMRQQIKVNHPLVFRGIKVYLASQGVLLQARVLDSHNKILNSAEIAIGETMFLPGPEGKSMRILRYIPDYDPAQPWVSKTLQPRNPYVVYTMYRNGEPERRQAAPVNEPQPIDGGSTFVVFSRVLPVAGLHIKYDPGLPFVWIGFGLLIAGMYFIYYTPYRQIWIQVVPENGGLAIVCAERGPDMAMMQDKIRCFLTGQ